MKLVLFDKKTSNEERKNLSTALEDKKYQYKSQKLYQSHKDNIIGYAIDKEINLYPMIQMKSNDDRYNIAIMSSKHTFFFSVDDLSQIALGDKSRWLLYAHGRELESEFSPVEGKESLSIDFMNPSGATLQISDKGIKDYLDPIDNNLQDLKTYGKIIYKNGEAKQVIYTDEEGNTLETLKKDEQLLDEKLDALFVLQERLYLKLEEQDEKINSLMEIICNSHDIELQRELKDKVIAEYKIKDTIQIVYFNQYHDIKKTAKQVCSVSSAKLRTENNDKDLLGVNKKGNDMKDISLSNYGLKERGGKVKSYEDMVANQLEQLGNVGLIHVNSNAGSKLSGVIHEMKKLELQQKLIVVACRGNSSEIEQSHVANYNLGPSAFDYEKDSRLSMKIVDNMPKDDKKLHFFSLQQIKEKQYEPESLNINEKPG